MRETQVSFGELAGVLTEPAADPPAPMVLLLHGSGPLDRNENSPGQQLNIFNTFAEYLANRGYACLRYDKRGCGRSGGNFLASDQSDFVRDAAACLDGIDQQFPGRFKTRYLLGHSEGTAIAARLSLERDLAGLVLLCPYIQDMEAILMDQAGKLDSALDEATGFFGLTNRAIARLIGRPSKWQARLIRKVKASRKPTIRFLGRRLPAGWLRECLGQDLRALYARVKTPTLVLGGGKDIQCDPQDVAQIGERLGSEAETGVFADMTHILRLDPDPPSFNTYQRQMSQPLAPELLQRVGEWLDRQTATTGR